MRVVQSGCPVGVRGAGRPDGSAQGALTTGPSGGTWRSAARATRGSPGGGRGRLWREGPPRGRPGRLGGGRGGEERGRGKESGGRARVGKEWGCGRPRRAPHRPGLAGARGAGSEALPTVAAERTFPGGRERAQEGGRPPSRRAAPRHRRPRGLLRLSASGGGERARRLRAPRRCAAASPPSALPRRNLASGALCEPLGGGFCRRGAVLAAPPASLSPQGRGGPSSRSAAACARMGCGSPRGGAGAEGAAAQRPGECRPKPVRVRRASAHADARTHGGLAAPCCCTAMGVTVAGAEA